MLNDNFSLSIESSSPLRATASDVDVVRSPSAHLVRNQRGLALVSAFLFVLLLTFSWFAFSYYSSYEEGMIRNQIRSDQAAYLAEAGVQQALWLLSRDWNWRNWTANHEGVVGAPGVVGTVSYYQWTGNLGETDKSYKVQIRSDGQIQSKIVSTGTSDTVTRTVTIELGSAFDFGLYSHKDLSFQTRSFSVTGANSRGFVYAKDRITDPSNLLSANKKTGNFSTAPSFLPKAIPLPELWKTQNPQTGSVIGFKAKINGAPTSTSVRYNNDVGEGNLIAPAFAGALLHNKTRCTRSPSQDFLRKITAVNLATTTITTQTASGDGWIAGDDIVVERLEIYENYWATLDQRLNDLLTAGASISPTAGVDFTDQNLNTDTRFSPASSNNYTVQFRGTTTISANVIIEGNGIFGRSSANIGTTTVSGNLVVKGNAYFFNQVNITGNLYVIGSVYMFDNTDQDWSHAGSLYRDHWLFYDDSAPFQEDWRAYLGSADYDGTDGRVDFDADGSGSIFYRLDFEGDEVDPYVDHTASSTLHGITIGSGGGLFTKKSLYVREFAQSTSLNIQGHCYVNEDATLYYGSTNLASTFIGTVIISNYSNPVERGFCVRNGSLTVGSPDPAYNNRLANLQGSGRIIVGKDITVTRDLYANQSAAPLLIASAGSLAISRNVGATGNPFYGMVYVGENASLVGTVTISSGLMIANNFSQPLAGTSIYYPTFDKTLLVNAGFSNFRDFSRPLLWSEH
jgi:hypothetical protein